MIITTENLAEAIKTLRTKTGLSQSELAAAAGVNMHTISRIERDLASPTIRILEKIIQAITNAKGYKQEEEQEPEDSRVLLSFEIAQEVQA